MDSCCVYEFIEMVGVTDLFLCNQYFMLMEYLHIQGVPGGMCQTSGGCSLC